MRTVQRHTKSRNRIFSQRNLIVFASVATLVGAFLMPESFGTVTAKIWDSNADWATGSLSNTSIANGSVNLAPTSSGAANTTNLALNRPSFATSKESKSLASQYAFDGKTNTRWASQEGVDPQYVYVDLGSVQKISEVKLNWEAAYAKAYAIAVSNDAKTWTNIYTTSSGIGRVEDLRGLSGSGRYISMYGTVRGTKYGYSLYEMSVYGPGSITTYATSGNITLSFDATSNATWTSAAPQANVPAGTGISYQYRVSSDNVNWSVWNSDITKLANSRYIQILATLSTTNSRITPSLDSLTLNYNVSSATTGTTLATTTTKATTTTSKATTTTSKATTTTQASTTTTKASGTVYIFDDEFNGAAGAAPDPTKWNNNPSLCSQLGDNYSCMKNENAFTNGAGSLVMRIKRDSSTSTGYSGSMIATFNWGSNYPPTGIKASFAVPYHIEMRALMPNTAGAWPALWTEQIQKPADGSQSELDIAEERMTSPTSAGCHQHTWLGGADKHGWDGGVTVSNMALNWHTYSADVYTDHVNYLVDGQLCGTGYGVSGVHGILLDNVLGKPGSWGSGGGSPSSSDAGPWDMTVDYVRVSKL